MKTKLVRPVLVPTKDTESILVIDDNSRQLHICKPNEAAWGHQQIVLVSLDPNDSIEENDKFVINDNVYKCHEIKHTTKEVQCIHYGTEYYFNQINCNKVIATQDQLSPDHIHKLVDEYNNGEMQNFEIEMDWILGDEEDENQNLIPVLQPKLTNNFITIVEKEHNIPYPEEPMEEDGVIGKSYDHGFLDGYEARRFEEPIMYNEEEVAKLFNEFAKKLSYEFMMERLKGLDAVNFSINWFNENKKKQ